MSDVHPLLRKVLALTILFGLAMLVWIGIARPLQQRYAAYDDTMSQSQRLLEKYDAVGDAAGALERQLKALQADQSLGQGFIQGDSVELAGADMQERIKSIVESGGGRLKSSQVLATTEEDGAQRLGVRINMTGDIDALQKVLYDFEVANPYFFVDKLNIQASRWAVRRARARRNVRRGNPAEMQVRFDVYAYLRPSSK